MRFGNIWGRKQQGRTRTASRPVPSLKLGRVSALLLICIAAILQASCNAGVTSTPPAQQISITLTPKSATLFLGQTQSFQATVTGTANTAVIWEVNGVAQGSPTGGEISSGGVYAAPGTMPVSPGVTVAAVSAADSSATASAAITLTDNIIVTVSPSSADVPGGGEQIFSAAVAGTGNPTPGVSWTVDGIAGGNSTLGTITPGAGNAASYTAPSVPPQPANVTITATSLADDSKTGSASVTVTCSATNSISPSSPNVGLGSAQSFNASFCLAPGATITWTVNGIIGGSQSYGTVASTGPASALYSAPADLPAGGPVTLLAAATAVTSGANQASASITIISDVTVAISPSSATLATSQRISLTANVSGSPDAAASWFVNGVANGNATVGEICVSGSNPCASPTGPAVGSVDFLAPASIPSSISVTITAVSRADPSQSSSAVLAIVTAGPVSITVSPVYVFLNPSSFQPDTQQFVATVSGGANTAVAWNVQSAVAGQGCSGTVCGSIDAAGLYTAPAAAPSPNAITITATSNADTTKSAAATVVITSGPTIESISPSSVMAGAVESFPLVLRGVNFVAGSGPGASVILINGVPRSTACSTAGQCAISLEPSDVATPATLVIEVQNPGTPDSISNPAPFVIAPFDISTAIISLTAAQPVSSAENIIVTDPTTAAASSPINIESVGLLTNGTTCSIQGSPLAISPPASGTETVSICVYGNGLDPAFSYAFTGPAAAPNSSDIGVTASAVTGLLPGMIELNLQVSSTTEPGIRTLVITTLNNDRAVASGILEVK